jgi:hypothetical protein
MYCQIVKIIISVGVICMSLVVLTSCSDPKTSSGVSDRSTDVKPVEVNGFRAFQGENRTLSERTGRIHVNEPPGTMSSHDVEVDRQPSTDLLAASQASTVIKPKGGESWQKGKSYQIKWVNSRQINLCEGTNTKVRISLQKDNRVPYYKTIAKKTRNDGRYTWKIPNSLVSGREYKVVIDEFPLYFRNRKVYGNDRNCAPRYKSAQTFTITASGKVGSSGKLKVIKPNGDESWIIGKKYQIKWNPGSRAKVVHIMLWGVSDVMVMEKLTPKATALCSGGCTKNDGRFTWKVPSSLNPGKYVIQVTDPTNVSIHASGGHFTIKKKGGSPPGVNPPGTPPSDR